VKVVGILAAGGSGSRSGVAKQWLFLGPESVLRRSARALLGCPGVDRLVAVVPAGDEARARAELDGLDKPVQVVAGGATRAASVRAGVEAAGPCGILVIHDAARPFATPGLVARVIEAAARDGAALAALPCGDTVKRAEGERAVATVDRARLWLAQTPQAFRREVLEAAYLAAGPEFAHATDECGLAEAAGHLPTLVSGEPDNTKITSPEDVIRAQARALPPVAMGVGYDVHPFAPGRKLILGGVLFEGDGLAGHSDADVCTHAIADAVLGAVGLGDLGCHFPDTDPRWAGASSLDLLRHAVRLAAERGWRVGNCDVTIAARRPRIAPEGERMRSRLAEALGIAPGQVNVKATTGEGLGFVGRGEGIAAHAVAVLVR
jgi:2-C-methyl-D-erythritol 4-phosphate cytidylyltransferase/2-C-methyl-D-erythritol 2,4-cyclodiphosphate synthase